MWQHWPRYEFQSFREPSIFTGFVESFDSIDFLEGMVLLDAYPPELAMEGSDYNSFVSLPQLLTRREKAF